MAGPFKMKGNPMKRNFGIGSPLKQEETRSDTTITGRMLTSNPPQFPVKIKKGSKTKTVNLSEEEFEAFMKKNPSGTTKGKTYKKDRSGKGAKSFDEAFAAAKKAGKTTFRWRNKTYSTKTA
tara:strand:+ start:121 stop:486 length:366 start_codon:yes stop_codon:yes gene_type:complete